MSSPTTKSFFARPLPPYTYKYCSRTPVRCTLYPALIGRTPGGRATGATATVGHFACSCHHAAVKGACSLLPGQGTTTMGPWRSVDAGRADSCGGRGAYHETTMAFGLCNLTAHLGRIPTCVSLISCIIIITITTLLLLLIPFLLLSR